MMNISEPWFEVQTYWGDVFEDCWVGECIFSTLEEAKVWANEYEIGNEIRIVQCFVVFKKGEVK